MIGIEAWQSVLNALGAVIAWLYAHVGQSYGLAIILLTIAVRLVLLPLGIKQIRGMHQMQQVQPKVKELQKKYKGNKQKINEETMKLYSEHGVNPLSSCLPLLLQLPVMFALIAVLRPPAPPTPQVPNPTHFPYSQTQPIGELQHVVVTYNVPPFLGMNLQCTPIDAGKPDVPVYDSTDKTKQVATLHCGEDTPLTKFPYYALILLMAGTSYYQQRQMQKAAPPGAAQQQQKAMQFLPLIFVFFFIRYPVGLTLYWTTTNLWQIGQQHFLLTALTKDSESGKAALPEKKTGSAAGDGKRAKKGFLARMQEEAERDRARKQREQGRPGGAADSKGGSGTPKKRPAQPGNSKQPSKNPGKNPKKKPNSGGNGSGSGGS